MDIRAVHPDRPDEFQAWIDAADVALSDGRPDPFGVRYDEMAYAVGLPRSNNRLEAYGLFEAGRCVGAAWLGLPLLDNLRRALFMVGVPPEYRGRGIGTALLEHLGGLAEAAGRTLWYANVYLPVDVAENAGTRFALRHGFTLRNVEIRRQLRLPLTEFRMAELEAYAAQRTANYRLRSWIGACPEEYVEEYAHLHGLMSTEAPSGELDVEAERWDAERQRADDRRIAGQGRTVFVTVAIAPDGTLAGHTRLYLSKSAPGRAQQGGTLVRKERRGHRLGLAMKLANLSSLLAAEPDVTRIDTENAEQNAPMVAVNVRMGFEIVERMQEFQRDL